MPILAGLWLSRHHTIQHLIWCFGEGCRGCQFQVDNLTWKSIVHWLGRPTCRLRWLKRHSWSMVMHGVCLCFLDRRLLQPRCFMSKKMYCKFAKFLRYINFRKGVPRLGPVCKAGDQIWSAVIRRDLAANACSEVAHERPRSEIVNKVTHTLTCTHARRYPFPWQLKMADVRLKFCAVSSFWSRLQTMVDEASSSVFRKQNATQVATQRSPWTRFAARTLLSVYSHILTWFWAVLLTTRVTWAGRLLVACIGAL